MKLKVKVVILIKYGEWFLFFNIAGYIVTVYKAKNSNR